MNKGLNILISTGYTQLNEIRLNMDFGQFGWLRHHQLQKGFEQAFTPDPDVEKGTRILGQ